MSGLAALADKAFGFKGRLRRRDYWLIGIALALIQMIVVEVVTTGLFGPEYGMMAAALDPFAVPDLPWSLVLVQSLLAAPVTWSSFAVTTKRFHDQNKSAKSGIIAWVIATLPTYVIPFVAPLWASSPLQWMTVQSVVGLVTFPAIIYVVVVAGFMDGTAGPNRFGPSPKAKEFAKVS